MLIASQYFYDLAMLVLYHLNCWFAHVYVDNRLILLCAIVVLFEFLFSFPRPAAICLANKDYYLKVMRHFY